MPLITPTDVSELLGVTFEAAYTTSCTRLIGLLEAGLSRELRCGLDVQEYTDEAHPDTHLEHIADGPLLVPDVRPVVIPDDEGIPSTTATWDGTALVLGTDFYVDTFGFVFLTRSNLPRSSGAPSRIVVSYSAGLGPDKLPAVQSTLTLAAARNMGQLIDGTWTVQSIGEQGEQITPRKVSRKNHRGHQVTSLFDQSEWAAVEGLDRRL